MDITLANIADYSNAISIAIIIGCFLSMAVFIIRLNLHGKVNMHPGDIIPGRIMKGVHNPYSIKLDPNRSATLKDGVWLEMRCQAPCVVQALWGVSIEHVYPGIYLQWADYFQQVQEDTWLEEHVTFRGSPKRYEPCDKIRLKLEVPDEVDLYMGTVPRTKYPLVVVLLNDEFQNEQTAGLCVTSVVTLFHLRDDECPGKSHIICQYIRTPVGSPCQLQQLFVASVDDESEENAGVQNPDTDRSDAPGTPDDNTPSGDCIVCHTETINRALLPCRHVCVCDGCFLRLDKCPMCRSVIESYFQLTPKEGTAWPEEEDDTPKPWWQDWNDRLNDYLGFS